MFCSSTSWTKYINRLISLKLLSGHPMQLVGWLESWSAGCWKNGGWYQLSRTHNWKMAKLIHSEHEKPQGSKYSRTKNIKSPLELDSINELCQKEEQDKHKIVLKFKFISKSVRFPAYPVWCLFWVCTITSNFSLQVLPTYFLYIFPLHINW